MNSVTQNDKKKSVTICEKSETGNAWNWFNSSHKNAVWILFIKYIKIGYHTA